MFASDLIEDVRDLKIYFNELNNLTSKLKKEVNNIPKILNKKAICFDDYDKFRYDALEHLVKVKELIIRLEEKLEMK